MEYLFKKPEKIGFKHIYYGLYYLLLLIFKVKQNQQMAGKKPTFPLSLPQSGLN